MKELGDVSLQLVETLDEAFACKRWLGERREILAVDTETGGFDYWSEPLRMVVLADVDTGYAIPWHLWAGVVHETLGVYEGPTVYHNLPFDLHFLETNGVKIHRESVNDTLTASHLIAPLGMHGLKPLSNKWIDPRATVGQESLHDGMHENGWTWATVPHDFPPYWIYAALDGVLTARLWHKFRPLIAANYQNVYDLEIAVNLVLTDMVRRGARVDLPYVAGRIADADAYLLESREWVEAHYGCSPTANRQVADALIADGVVLSERTPTGHWKLDEPVLATLAGHPLADAVLSMRKIAKTKKSYFEAIQARADGDVIHADTLAIGARTGRMSISSPPLQQLPRGPVVRDAFIPREGNALVSCDFDQVEMRLFAHFANEKGMIDAIRSGVDLHSFVAEMIFGEGYSKDERQITKNTNFSKVFCAGVETFSKTAGISLDYGTEIMAKYDDLFPDVTSFFNEVERIARHRLVEEKEAYVTTPIGRRQPGDSDRLYALVNFLIQGTAADVFKRALVDLDHAGLGEYLILPVHDEAILDVPSEIADEVARETSRIMSDPDTFQVPLTAGAEVLGSSWGNKFREKAA